MTGSNSTVTNKDVTDFVQKAGSGGMMEVELGNLAATNAQSDRVKAFGAMMVSDHTAAGNELKQLASSNNIQAPSMLMPDHQKHVDMLKSKTGAAFDKAYMDMMVKDHKEDVAEYKKASTGLSVQTYKDFASKTLPTLQKHLDSAQAVHKSLK
jgi:putative membrane protein